MTATQAISTDQTGIAHEVFKRADTIGAWASGHLDYAIASADKAATFAYKEAIDIAMQYIAFGRVYITVLMLISLLLIGVSLKLLSYVVKEVRTKRVVTYSENFDSSIHIRYNFVVSWSISSFVSAFIGFIIAIVNTKDLILVWVAPKLWLLIELAEIVKKFK